MNLSNWSGLCLIAMSVCWACDDPTEGKPAAAVDVPQAEEPAAAKPADETEGESSASAQPLVFGQADSSIEMVGSKVTGSHDIEVQEFSGTIDLEQGAPLEQGKVKVEMDLNSVKADEKKLTKHLKSDDFFDVPNHPTATFVSTKIVKGGTDGATHTVTGNLTLRGNTKSITFPATLEREGDKVVIKAEFSIDRTDFGIVYKGMPDDLIRHDVLIKLDIKAAPTA